MHPQFFTFHTPHYLHGLLPESITIYWYGLLITTGSVLAIIYIAKEANKQYNLSWESSIILLLLMLVSGYIGGKGFLFFEDTSFYLSNPAQLFSGSGFVFYGSLLFNISTMYIFVKVQKLPLGGMLDIMVIGTSIAHIMGRLGCFMAGCCYGLPTSGLLSVTFTGSNSQAFPLNSPLHPTQLYSVALISVILIMLFRIKKRKLFDGQLFVSYLIFYASGRTIIEIFRGDLQRGFIIENYLSHSQFISILIIASAMYIYYRLYKRAVA
ncbi:Prolipoprotein diacylglyceryl transferase [hydrothermal vent metagenome]|uniref:Prolipoprotein diacylglyceryl transferase n=1 Tax=hydrothermal vent metagenome TaxID=652676 RepID=A0A3B0UB94_9ZZZZ